jgi:hypothetical protein
VADHDRVRLQHTRAAVVEGYLDPDGEAHPDSLVPAQLRAALVPTVVFLFA